MLRYLYIKDRTKRLLFKKHELKLLKRKYLYNSNCLNLSLNNFVINNSFLSFSKVRIKNRCFLTFRSKSVFRLFKMSRIVFRNLVSFGLICGFKKSSW